jgi:hypothetical protein
MIIFVSISTAIFFLLAIMLPTGSSMVNVVWKVIFSVLAVSGVFLLGTYFGYIIKV